MNSILQTKEWAEFKESQGFEIIEVEGLYIHKRNLPFGQNFLYLPEVSAQKITPGHIEEIKKAAKDNDSIFVRLEVLDEFSENADQMIQAFGFKKAFEEVQPKWRQILDLSKSEEEILAQMKPKGRYNIKIATKNKIQISNLKVQNDNSKLKIHNSIEIQNSSLRIFYNLYKETVKREKIAGRSYEYFEKMLDSFKETDYFKVYTAMLGNEPVAAAIISFYDGMANYMYGGSSREHKEVMAPYLMHFQIIKDAKAEGLKQYDLLGRAKPGDEKSNWAGLTRFKEQFGGLAVEILGSYDYVNKSSFYTAFKILEKTRRH